MIEAALDYVFAEFVAKTMGGEESEISLDCLYNLLVNFQVYLAASVASCSNGKNLEF